MGRAALGEQARAGREKGWAAPGRAGRKEVRDGLGHAELGQAEACAGRTGRPSGVASWAQERSLGCLRLGRPGGESGLGPVAKFWAGLV